MSTVNRSIRMNYDKHCWRNLWRYRGRLQHQQGKDWLLLFMPKNIHCNQSVQTVYDVINVVPTGAEQFLFKNPKNMLNYRNILSVLINQQILQNVWYITRICFRQNMFCLPCQPTLSTAHLKTVCVNTGFVYTRSYLC